MSWIRRVFIKKGEDLEVEWMYGVDGTQGEGTGGEDGG